MFYHLGFEFLANKNMRVEMCKLGSIYFQAMALAPLQQKWGEEREVETARGIANGCM